MADVPMVRIQACWDADAARDEYLLFVIETFGVPEGIGVVDETGFLKQGKASVGVAGQYTGTAGKTANCQVGTFLSYATAQAQVFLDRPLYLPDGHHQSGPQRRLAEQQQQDGVFVVSATQTVRGSNHMSYSSKPCVVVLTDFFKDPDDKQSMICFLSYANEFDVEGLIATSLAYGTGEVHPEWVVELINIYEKVRPSLLQHDDEYPSADVLRRVVKAGAPVIREWVGGGRGFATPQGFADDSRSCGPPANYIGPDQDTPASEHIIQVLTSMDPRPVWIIVWGGPMDLAQALWRLRNDLGADSTELKAIIGKIRLFQTSWQDTGAVWLCQDSSSAPGNCCCHQPTTLCGLVWWHSAFQDASLPLRCDGGLADSHPLTKSIQVSQR